MYGANYYGSTYYGRKSFNPIYTFVITKPLLYAIKVSNSVTKALRYTITLYRYKYVPQGTVYTEKY